MVGNVALVESESNDKTWVNDVVDSMLVMASLCDPSSPGLARRVTADVERHDVTAELVAETLLHGDKLTSPK